MKNAILIHGTCDKEEYFDSNQPSLSNAHWFPWLQKQLLVNSIFCQTPEMPDAHTPVYDKWKKEFERFEVNEDTVLVGHSCGGGFLIRWLTENKIKLNKLILVAPWLDPDRVKTSGFFDFAIDSEMIKRIGEVHLLVSNDDDKDIRDSVEKIVTKLPDIKVHKFDNMGHFTFGQMKTEKFPELLNLILS
ncbi:hypothetical protein A2130_02375 [Candidatus Woesebacteria bacterium GWC2_33_12]|uniref:Alpha/beta hydrolase n=1 Tax=Candidatus Woesebacteria bacterium GW2011_GWB1_33_22 TaxID=1618566 RepID=A0A0F9ZMF3_9BACT|nr:MAG: hypothetical protein UR29_C0006G0014 [Candidatus Woesebacteria bacterium GW2011_GWC2_33_12]KKP42803.1 MAG: hypothetical protein UR33_C0001G0164 [Candidatus Woesebacteria bacterium GW2011_GWA2_33_20]KKP45423.1 MAG: hypothetical protein UR35_C0001G0020 [Candidatus Woesebacteria bacterium GW2011_GWB1_33_22]KKP46264.1 MAG: hypothetical protein UR37_C0010G0020 [Microgenomates group bacterium GW2011_GWC1_33_28]KKP50373.1 MAG: hypothetical protein UR41_C0009G0020 [Candidatus Woesebacteria bact